MKKEAKSTFMESFSHGDSYKSERQRCAALLTAST
jgi:hypothetical protein